MANLMPREIVDEVRRVLSDVARNLSDPPFLTAYQVLALLPEEVRDRLIAERTKGGSGAGVSFAAPSVVAMAAQMIDGIEIRSLHAHGLGVNIAGESVSPGYEVVAIYRLTAPSAGAVA